jgi:hypothetical protein
MSMVKMLGRIVSSREIEEKEDDRAKSASMLHKQTYGIASDPLTHFACIFSALIHDLDHPGVRKYHSRLDLYHYDAAFSVLTLIP